MHGCPKATCFNSEFGLLCVKCVNDWAKEEEKEERENGGGAGGEQEQQSLLDVAERFIGARGQCVTMEYGALVNAMTCRRQTQPPAILTRF